MRAHHFATLASLLALVTTPALPCSLRAQEDEWINREARRIFETVMSPYCPGRTIANCPSPEAAELQTAIRRELRSGKAPEEVKEELYATFGDEIRSAPRASGFGLLAWAIPGLALLGGGLGLAAWLRRTRLPQPADASSVPAEIDPVLQARLEKELSDLESIT